MEVTCPRSSRVIQSDSGYHAFHQGITAGKMMAQARELIDMRKGHGLEIF